MGPCFFEGGMKLDENVNYGNIKGMFLNDSL